VENGESNEKGNKSTKSQKRIGGGDEMSIKEKESLSGGKKHKDKQGCCGK